MDNYHIKRRIKWNDIAIFFSSLYLISIILFTYSSSLIIYSELIFVILFVTTIFKIIQEKKIQLSKLYIILALFILWSTLSSFWAIDIHSHIYRLKTLLQLSLLCIIYYIIYDEKKSIDKFIRGFLIAGYLMCFYALYIYGGWSSFVIMMSVERLGTEINQANVFGYYASLTVLFSYYLAFYKRKPIFFGLMVIPFIMALSSGSKRALILMIIGIFMLTYLKYRNKKIIKTVVYVLIISVIIFFILKMPIFSMVSSRIDTMINIFNNGGKIDSSTINRQRYINYGWSIFKESPLTGFGLNAFTAFTQDTYSHNNYIEMLVNGGIVGFMLYYNLILNPLIRLSKTAMKFDKVSILLSVILLIGFVNDIATVSYYTKMQFVIIGVCFAYADINDRLNNFLK